MTKITKKIITLIFGAIAFVAFSFGLVFTMPQVKTAKAAETAIVFNEALLEGDVPANGVMQIRLNTEGLTWQGSYNDKLVNELPGNVADHVTVNGRTLTELSNACTSATPVRVTLQPAGTFSFIEKLYADVPALQNVTLGLHCSDACGLALATALESLSAGIGQLDLCCAGNQAPNTAATLAILAQRSEKLDITTSVLYTEAKTCAAAAASLFDKKSGSKVSVALQNEGEGLLLDAGADKHTVLAEVAKLGYTLYPEDANRVFEEFRQIAQSKPIGTRELDTLVAAVAMQVPSTYKLVTYVINSGNTFSSSAHVTVQKSGKTLQAISLGDGPIDAAFKALEQIVGHHYELDDFQIHAVTEGREAVGSALVKLRSEGTLHAGQGVSTDIIGASIRAYLDALNKIVYEEGLA